ncbi:MAG TPA: hypothetical protein VJN96_03400 [Vicinamibacterales bacterium]|nr:hypothetical protein [Vicinamibacterales bacterium]
MAQARVEAQREWARLGALARLQQIEAERVAILAAFPDLRRKASAAPAPSPRLVIRPRRTISAKGRRAMSAGMRKYWAKRRAAQQKSK